MQKKINGNTAGVRQSLLDQLAALYDMGDGSFAPYGILELIAQATGVTGREISVYLSRDGRVVDVSMGDAGAVSMPDVRLVRNGDRLCGVRCIHTHPNGDGRLSAVDEGTLRSMKLDAMCALGVIHGRPGPFYAAFLGEAGEEGPQLLHFGPYPPHAIPGDLLLEQVRLADVRLMATGHVVAQERERAILVGLGADERAMNELEELAQSAGLQVVGRCEQKRGEVDNATYIGSGKARELALLASELEATLCVFDDELSAVQLRNLEVILDRRVIDRTMLILDIFAARAVSREGKLQVELAQLKYRLPRLVGRGLAMSRQGMSGVGMRGPGEKKLEVDRRRIRRRIYELTQELEQVALQRDVRRARREKNPQPLVALVGYTNAGKSTLLNALSGSDVLSADMLFATLDPVVRQVELPGGMQALVSDTVGFIDKLPHELVQAFHSTLEEVRLADLILHVADASNPTHGVQMRVVEHVLEELGAGATKRVDVMNKADLLPELPSSSAGVFYVSARTGAGLEALLARVQDVLSQVNKQVELEIPYARYDVMSLLQEEGLVLETEHGEEGTRVRVQASDAVLGRVRALLDG